MALGSVKLRNKCFIKHAIKGPARSVDINPNSVEHVYDEGIPVQQAHSDSPVEQPVLSADQGERSESRPRTRARARQLSGSPQ